jgi:signal transduction histidine kinase
MEILGFTREITERRKIREAFRESEKRMQSLYTNPLNAQEAERKRIPIELHDELGQVLIVLGY